MVKLIAICFLVSTSFLAQAQTRQIPVNPFDLKVDQTYTGAWNGTEIKLLYNGNTLLNINLSDDQRILNEAVLRAQASKTMVLLDFEAIDRAANIGWTTSNEEHLADISKILTPTSIPIPADSDREKIRRLE